MKNCMCVVATPTSATDEVQLLCVGGILSVFEITNKKKEKTSPLQKECLTT
jgi:hypothetical protein